MWSSSRPDGVPVETSSGSPETAASFFLEEEAIFHVFLAVLFAVGVLIFLNDSKVGDSEHCGGCTVKG